MSQDRLIIKQRPRHHKQQFFAAMGLGVIGVLAIWGWQIKMTFAEYAAERDQEQTKESLDVVASIADNEVVIPQENINEIKGLLQQLIDQKVNQEVAVDPSPEAQVPNPVIAGETIEVPAN